MKDPNWTQEQLDAYYDGRASGLHSRGIIIDAKPIYSPYGPSDPRARPWVAGFKATKEKATCPQ